MSNSLSQAGYDVKVICLQDKETELPDSEESDGFQINRININTRNLPKILNSIKYLEFLFKAKIMIRSFAPQIIHCHDFNTLLAGVISSKNAKIIYDSHELEANRSGISRLNSYFVSFLEKTFLKFVSACITVNDEIAEIISKKYNIRVHSIFNAYSPSEIEIDDRFSIRKRINAGDDKFIAIYPGVLSYNRGLLKLMESAPYLNENVIIVMIGYGPQKEELRNEVIKRKRQNRIFILDAVPYKVVIQYIATSDLGLMPTLNTSLSYQLGLGNKFFQYVAAGIPIAVSDQPVKRKMLSKYNLGVVFDPEEPYDIAQKINSLVNDKEKYFQLKNNCKNAQQFLCWENEEQKLKDIYSELI
jgi:glycosyltransferase involved in cell wall biosynthesis